MRKENFRKSLVVLLFSCFGILSVLAENQPKFIENKGQLPSQVAYKLQVANADLFFEKDRLTFNFYNPELLHQHGHAHQESEFVGHAYQMVFLNSSSEVEILGEGNRYSDYINYISKQKSVGHVASFTRVSYRNIYEGIDLEYFGSNGNLKYDIIVDAGVDPSIIQFKYEGADKVQLKRGKLLVKNNFNSVEESIPMAYQIINGQQVVVDCKYSLEGDVVAFQFPDGYNSEYELVIDPTLIFSSYTGSTANNFGFTATYDEDGALYGGGISFGLGYPIITGAYAETFGGVVDMAISKFSPDGTALEYSTFIGGASADVPHSMIVNSLGELVILGSTSSLDYPTSPTGFDATFNGGTAANYTSNGTNYQNGSDIVVSVLSADGTALVGSTYLGGFLNDGLNDDGILSYNYGDIFRGEVIVDGADNIYILSSTKSADFPTTTGALDETLGGTQDACLAKFNPDVSVLEWCTYIGGSAGDAGYSLKLNSANELYVTGGTASSNLAVDAGAIFPTYGGGSADGYLFRISNDGSTIINSSYIGTSSYDQSYFVEVDDEDAVYLYGQSTGSYPVTGGAYFNLNGKQFIQKLTPDITTSIYSTVFGSGSANINISPTAFLVDVCKRVFVSGWGGSTNNSWNSSTGNTSGLATTIDGEQTTTDGSDFYFMVLEEDATALLYGSYFGGNGIAEHVDGGTSRFNDNGVIHQAVCAGCGSSNAFPTTPGVVSNINGNSCNLGVIKLDLEISAVQVDITGGGSQTGCAPFDVDFEADLVNATDFIWYFGDGDSANVQNPSHTYANPGVYEVMLIGTDTAFCTGETFTDTSITIITVNLLTDAAEAGTGAHLCPGDSVQIGADTIPGYTYSWDPPLDLSDPTGSNPFASPTEDVQYYLTILNADGCEDVDSVMITVFGIEAFPDTVICTNDSVLVSVIGGSSFSWLPVAGVSNPTSSSTYITAGLAPIYTVTASDGLGCEDTAIVNLGALVGPTALFDVEISQSCLGDSVQFLNMSDNADSYEWNIGGLITNEDEPIILFEPGDGPVVYLIATNNNGECIDTLTIDYMNGWYSEDSVTVTYPNVFTPDGDNINDCFKPDFTGDLDDCFTLKVFSRWGRLLYDSEKHGGNCWDGTQRTDDLVSRGTYYYIANVRGMDHAGFVTVLYK